MDLVAIQFVSATTSNGSFCGEIDDGVEKLSPAKKCKDGVGCEASQSCEADTHTDAPRPEAAVVAVIVELELAADDGDQGEDAPGGDAVPVQLPAEPPFVNVIICCHKKSLDQESEPCHDWPIIVFK